MKTEKHISLFLYYKINEGAWNINSVVAHHYEHGRGSSTTLKILSLILKINLFTTENSHL